MGYKTEAVKMLGSVLKALLSERDVSVSTLSKETGVPKSNINSWLQGGNPNVDQLAKVAEYFSVTIDFLVSGKDRGGLKLCGAFEIMTGDYRVSIRRVTGEG